MNCRKVTHLLSAYMDGELPGVEHRLIHEHLTHCAECLADYEDLLQMKRLLGRMRIQSAHRDLPVQIINHIHAAESHANNKQPTDWLQIFKQALRTKLTTTQTLSLGLGLAAMAVFYTAQPNMSPQNVNEIGNVMWEQSPAVHEFLNGVSYADSERFLSRPSGSAIQNVSANTFFSNDESRWFERRTPSVQIEQLVFHR